MKVAIVHNKEAKTIEVTERLNALLEQAGFNEMIMSQNWSSQSAETAHYCRRSITTVIV